MGGEAPDQLDPDALDLDEPYLERWVPETATGTLESVWVLPLESALSAPNRDSGQYRGEHDREDQAKVGDPVEDRKGE